MRAIFFSSQRLLEERKWNKLVFLGLRTFSNVNVLHKGLLLQDQVFRLGIIHSFQGYTLLLGGSFGLVFSVLFRLNLAMLCTDVQLQAQKLLILTAETEFSSSKAQANGSLMYVAVYMFPHLVLFCLELIAKMYILSTLYDNAKERCSLQLFSRQIQNEMGFSGIVYHLIYQS